MIPMRKHFEIPVKDRGVLKVLSISDEGIHLADENVIEIALLAIVADKLSSIERHLNSIADSQMLGR